MYENHISSKTLWYLESNIPVPWLPLVSYRHQQPWRLHCTTDSYPWSIMSEKANLHDDVIRWKHFPCYWPFLRGIHLSPVNSPHKGQCRGALMFSLICAWMNNWANNREAGNLRRHGAHYDVTVMAYNCLQISRPLSNIVSWLWHQKCVTQYVSCKYNHILVRMVVPMDLAPVETMQLTVDKIFTKISVSTRSFHKY